MHAFSTLHRQWHFSKQMESSKSNPNLKKVLNPTSITDQYLYYPLSQNFRKIIYQQLYDYLNENKLLSNYQSGFRSLYSTQTALLETANNWSINIDNGLLNGVIFSDLKKAFDTIDHEIILRKLVNYGVDENSLRWFASFLSNRGQKCNVNSDLSNANEISCGVPQGSIIGPLLFLIYINDLPNCLTTACAKMFAGDTNISIPGRTLADLEPMINPELANLNCWLKANRLSLNLAKTEFMIIGSRQRLLAESNDEICVSLENQRMERVNHTKTLGVTIDDRLSWSNYINDICEKVSSAIGALKRIRTFVSQSTAIQI